MKVKGAAFRSLRAYYRSGPVSLMSWVNKEIYRSSLSIFPYADPGKNRSEFKLHVAGGAAEASNGAPVKSWAGTLVDALLEHVKLHPKHSIGIVTQGAADSELIQRELERRRRKDQKQDGHVALSKGGAGVLPADGPQPDP